MQHRAHTMLAGTSRIHIHPSRSFVPSLPSYRTRHGPTVQHVAAEASSLASAGEDSFDKPFIFPRLKEKDPYRLLGVDREAFPEEIIEAKNYLIDQFRAHEPSREAIEMAFEKIMMSDKWRLRLKRGMIRVNKKTGKVEGERDDEGPFARVKTLLEPVINTTVILNKAAPYAALAIWAIIQFRATGGDVILPVMISLGYSIYSLFDKRNTRNPEGPYAGGSPLFGSVGYVLLSVLLGGLLGTAIEGSGLLPRHWDGALFSVVLMILFNFIVVTFFK